MIDQTLTSPNFPPTRIALTGGSGFIGSKLARFLTSIGVSIVDIGRHPSVMGAEFLDLSRISEASFATTLRGCKSLLHLAGQTSTDRFDIGDKQLWRVNYELSLDLARQASIAGVKRFVFLSSLRVNGAEGRFRETDEANPFDSYGRSKLAAENGLRLIALESGMELVVVRSPMVYGPGVKGNFATLVRLVRLRVPLPLACVENRRSMIGLNNLVSFLVMLSNPGESSAAANQVFFVSDDESISTATLVRRIAAAYKTKCWLLKVPSGLLWWAAKLFREEDLSCRLLGSLEVDTTKCKVMLGWYPTVSMQDEIQAMAAHDSIR